ncbi:MAG: hypothetical protein RR403_07810, partial [Pseudoflavonifractor sp.]
MNQTYYTGRKLFTGRGVVDDFAMLAEGGTILAVGSQQDVTCPADAERVALEGWVTPGLLDCHVHIIGSELMNENATPRETAQLICEGAHNAWLLLTAGVVACR